MINKDLVDREDYKLKNYETITNEMLVSAKRIFELEKNIKFISERENYRYNESAEQHQT